MDKQAVIKGIAITARKAQLKRTEEVMKHVREATEVRDVERDGFAQELALQYGFEYLDDDAEVMFVRVEALTDMMSVLGFRTRREREELIHALRVAEANGQKVTVTVDK